MKTTVYTPDSSLANPFIMVKAMMTDLWAGRELAWRLTVRDFLLVFSLPFLFVSVVAVLVLLISWIGYRLSFPILIERMSV